MHRHFRVTIAVAAALGTAGTASGAEVTGLTSFTAGTPARAAEVNGNFASVKTAVDDNNARVAALEEQVATLQAQLTNVLALNQYLTVQTVNSQPTVRFTGVNVQIVNGMGQTATANGTGNLLVGYDEVRNAITSQCSLGTDPNTLAAVTLEAQCAAAGGTWAVSHKSGSHYVVIGAENNYTRWGGLVTGFRNTSNYDYASVSGGVGNVAGGTYASVTGGTSNRASAARSTITGGQANVATGSASSILGGSNNEASGDLSGVAGGRQNTASGTGSTVGGGDTNVASGVAAHVSGGGNGTAAGGNVADQNYSSVLGGVGQNTSAASQTIPALP